MTVILSTEYSSVDLACDFFISFALGMTYELERDSLMAIFYFTCGMNDGLLCHLLCFAGQETGE